MNLETEVRAEPSAPPAAAPAVTNFVLYDDHCPLCTFQMKVLTCSIGST